MTSSGRTSRSGAPGDRNGAEREGNKELGQSPGAGGRKPEGRGSLLLVEHDAELRKAIGLCLQESGWRILCAGDAPEACAILDRETPEVLVMNVGPSPDRQGSVIASFRKSRRTGRRGLVVITADQHLDEAWRETQRPDAVVFKPFDVRHLSRRILRLVEDPK
jgi:DNA-binding response OmpR family regulator